MVTALPHKTLTLSSPEYRRLRIAIACDSRHGETSCPFLVEMFCIRTAPKSNTGEREHRPRCGSKPRSSVSRMKTGNVRRLERQPRQRRELRRGRPQRQQLERQQP